MHVALPELDSAVTLNLHRRVTAGDFESFCAENPSLRAELSAHGEIIINPPAGGESAYRSLGVSGELRAWAKQTKRGKAFDSSAAFVLPSGAILSPDAAWVSTAKLETLTPAQRRRFLRLSPDFIVEVLSPSDRRPAVESKMNDWIAAGVPLAWFIDADNQTVTVHRPATPPETHRGIQSITATSPIEGFTLDLTEIWAGL